MLEALWQEKIVKIQCLLAEEYLNGSILSHSEEEDI